MTKEHVVPVKCYACQAPILTSHTQPLALREYRALDVLRNLAFPRYTLSPNSSLLNDPSMYALAHLSRLKQWAVALLLAALCLGILGLCLVLPFLDLRWLLVTVVALSLTAPLESLLLTPLYTVGGRYRYYSPMLLATARPDRGLDLHAGTLFDYVTRLRWADRGPRAARVVTMDMLRGLVAIAEEVEQGLLPPHAEVVASSYFFSGRNAARFGFEQRDPPGHVILNLVSASLSLALRLSFTRGRPTFPDLRHIRQAVTTGERLVENKTQLQRLLDRLTQTEGTPG